MNEPKTEDQNEIFKARIQAGDESAINEMIVYNLPGVKAICRRFVDRQPRARFLFSELVSAGEERLAVSVNRLRSAKAVDANKYLRKAIRNCLRDYFLDFPSVGPRHAAIHERHAAGLPTGEMSGRSLEYADSVSRVQHNGKPLIQSRERGIAEAIAAVDTQDELEASCETESDRAFVSLRIAGHSEKEIAAKLGVSLRTVARTSQRIREIHNFEALNCGQRLTTEEAARRCGISVNLAAAFWPTLPSEVIHA